MTNPECEAEVARLRLLAESLYSRLVPEEQRHFAADMAKTEAERDAALAEVARLRTACGLALNAVSDYDGMDRDPVLAESLLRRALAEAEAEEASDGEIVPSFMDEVDSVRRWNRENGVGRDAE